MNNKTAEEPNAERVLFTKIIEASPGENFIDIQDEINNVANDPGHAVVVDAMHEYANQVSAPLKKRIAELEDFLQVEVSDSNHDFGCWCPGCGKSRLNKAKKRIEELEAEKKELEYTLGLWSNS